MSATSIHPIREAVQGALASAGVRCTDPVVIACSGGADSSVLADVMMGLASSAEVGPVTLVYVDHGLRPNTAADAAFVETLAEIGGASFRCVAVNVDRKQASLEDAARRARYPALEEVATELGAPWILTAHTASDQAETVILRMIRGTGVFGLAGIPRRRGKLLRPLLDVTRAAVDDYRARFDVGAIEDPTNTESVFARNRVRQDLLPRLRVENPKVDEALCRLAGSASEQRAALDYAATELLLRASSTDRRIDVAPLRAAPPAVAKRALVLLSESIGSTPLEARHLESLMRVMRRQASGSIQLDLPGLTAIREYDSLRLRPAGYIAPAPMRQVRVQGPKPPYEVRRWRAGDRMRPGRLKGRSRKLSDLYGDAKVPREARSLALVVARAGDGAIEWAEHLGPAWQSQVQVTLV